MPECISRQLLRTASLSATAALAVVQEAWDEAELGQLDPQRIGLIVGGSNVQQRELVNLQDSYRERIAFLRPTYALSFMDSDLCGFCTAHFGIQGLAYTVGGASASGQLAVIQAAQAVLSGQVDACIAVGALMDLSYWECQGFRAIGAMGSDRFAASPELACRPFDRDHDGFIYGECSGAIVIESLPSSRRRAAAPYATLTGWGLAMDGNRNPDPSFQGETRAIRAALAHADCPAEAIDYVNPHGTGSMSLAMRLKFVRCANAASRMLHLNATKSLVGHGLSAAGAVEIIATLLQLRAGRLHPTRNLDNPIDPDLRWVGPAGTTHQIATALTLSMGFGGMNTALCWNSCP